MLLMTYGREKLCSTINFRRTEVCFEYIAMFFQELQLIFNYFDKLDVLGIDETPNLFRKHLHFSRFTKAFLPSYEFELEAYMH